MVKCLLPVLSGLILLHKRASNKSPAVATADTRPFSKMSLVTGDTRLFSKTSLVPALEWRRSGKSLYNKPQATALWTQKAPAHTAASSFNAYARFPLEGQGCQTSPQASASELSPSVIPGARERWVCLGAIGMAEQIGTPFPFKQAHS